VAKKEGINPLFFPILVLLIAFCVFPQAPNLRVFEKCHTHYKFGEYIKAEDCLKLLLPKLTDTLHQATAYKMLAWSSVMLDMIPRAKQHFKKMLELAPTMELDTAANPPNITMVYRQVKLEHQLKAQAQETVRLKKALAQRNKQEARKRKLQSDSFWWKSTGLLSIAGGTTSLLFYLKGLKNHKHYQDAVKESEIQDYRDQLISDIRISQITLGATAALFFVATYKLVSYKKEKKRLSIAVSGRRINLVVTL